MEICGRASTISVVFFFVFTNLMVLGVLIIVLMDGLNTSTNGPASPVAAYWRWVQLQMNQQATELMIDDFKKGLVWNEYCNDSSTFY